MSKSQGHLLLAALNLVGFLGVVAVNALANALPLAGKTTGQLSDQYPNLFVPAGITFSIWGLIYILLGVYVVFGLVKSLRAPVQELQFMQRIGPLFLVTCIANAAWIFSWHYEVLPLSLVFMLILLAALGAIYLRLNVGKSAAGAAEKYLVHLPMSVYFGWVTVATIANATAVLVASGWNRFGLGEQVWAVIMIGIATALALFVLFGRRDLFYSLVVDWAVLGILIKRAADNQTPAPGVYAAAIAGICVMTLAIVVQLIRGRVYR